MVFKIVHDFVEIQQEKKQVHLVFVIFDFFPKEMFDLLAGGQTMSEQSAVFGIVPLPGDLFLAMLPDDSGFELSVDDDLGGEAVGQILDDERE